MRQTKKKKITMKFLNIRTPKKFAVNVLKVQDRMSNSSLGAVWSGSTLSARICLPENLGSLQY